VSLVDSDLREAEKSGHYFFSEKHHSHRSGKEALPRVLKENSYILEDSLLFFDRKLFYLLSQDSIFLLEEGYLINNK